MLSINRRAPVSGTYKHITFKSTLNLSNASSAATAAAAAAGISQLPFICMRRIFVNVILENNLRTQIQNGFQ